MLNRIALLCAVALALAACGPAPTLPTPPVPPASEPIGKKRIPNIDGLSWPEVKGYYDECMQFKDIADPRVPYVMQDCRAIRARWDRRDLTRNSTAKKAPQLPALH